MTRIPRLFTEPFKGFLAWVLNRPRGHDGYSWIPIEETLEPSFKELSERTWNRLKVESREAEHARLRGEYDQLKVLSARVLNRSGVSVRDMALVDPAAIGDGGRIRLFEALCLVDEPFVVYFYASRELCMLVGVSVHRLGEEIPEAYLEAAVGRIEDILQDAQK